MMLALPRRGHQNGPHLQQYQVGAPMEGVGVVILGRFPTTNLGDRYVLFLPWTTSPRDLKHIQSPPRVLLPQLGVWSMRNMILKEGGKVLHPAGVGL